MYAVRLYRFLCEILSETIICDLVCKRPVCAPVFILSQAFVSWSYSKFSDVSWGTKGDNKISTDLGTVQVGKNKNEVEVSVPTEETDINAAYEDALHVLSTKPPRSEKKPDPQTEQEDYYRSFRTKCVPELDCSLTILTN